MEAIIKFSLEIEIKIETEKEIKDTSVLELRLKASNLGNHLFDTIKNIKTHKLLNDKIHKDYKANIINVSPIKETKLII
jgi:hypothetical protein